MHWSIASLVLAAALGFSPKAPAEPLAQSAE
jgi:hypothetical protein